KSKGISPEDVKDFHALPGNGLTANLNDDITLTGGSVTITPAVSRVAKVKAGETVTLSFTPNTGLALNSVTLTGANGSTYTVTDTADANVKTFVMPDPATAITVNATF
ncbi:MAG: hypothetical protein IK123_02170, partial [Lachnospiraceae bacterium]|nr:hypothetical protein [Lachnospiraceae bacterium]